MRLMPLKIFAAAALLSAVGAGAIASRAAGDKTLAQLAGYREWARINAAPVPVEEPTGGG